MTLYTYSDRLTEIFMQTHTVSYKDTQTYRETRQTDSIARLSLSTEKKFLNFPSEFAAKKLNKCPLWLGRLSGSGYWTSEIKPSRLNIVAQVLSSYLPHSLS